MILWGGCNNNFACTICQDIIPRFFEGGKGGRGAGGLGLFGGGLGFVRSCIYGVCY